MSLTSNQTGGRMSEDVNQQDEFEVDGVEIEIEQDMAEQPDLDKNEQDAGDETETDTDNDEAESDPSSDKEESDKKEDWREKRIAKLTHQRKRAEERLRELEARLASGEKPAAAKESLPEVPAYPDADLQFSDPGEWKRQLAAREQAIEQRARAAARNEADQERQREAQKAQQTSHQKRVAEIAEKYVTSGLEQGLSEDRMAYNEEVLMDAGVSQDLAEYLYADSKGAVLVNFLADNPTELDKLQQMSPMRAVEHIALNLKPKVSSKKPGSTRAPNPVTRTRGTGTPPKDDFDKLMPDGYTIG